MDTFGLGSPNCFVVNLSSLVRRLTRSFCQRANRVLALDRVSLHDGSPLGDSSPSHCACVILRHCRLLSTAKPRMRHNHNDRSWRIQSWRKATKASFLKTWPFI